jgi:YHS domain-containing protein
MTVAVTTNAESTVRDGVRYYFCGPGCRARFEADPDRYVGLAGVPHSADA